MPGQRGSPYVIRYTAAGIYISMLDTLHVLMLVICLSQPAEVNPHALNGETQGVT